VLPDGRDGSGTSLSRPSPFPVGTSWAPAMVLRPMQDQYWINPHPPPKVGAQKFTNSYRNSPTLRGDPVLSPEGMPGQCRDHSGVGDLALLQHAEQRPMALPPAPTTFKDSTTGTGNTTCGRDMMITTSDRTRNQATGQEIPEESMRVIAEGLIKRGLTVSITGCEDSRRLKVTGTGNAACDVIVDEDYYFTCEYLPGRRDRQASPADTARVVARMLGTDYTCPQQYVHLHQGIPLPGAVGREMKARGMTVTLDVMPDEETYSAFVAIVITNPACPERGTVHLEKNWVCWECYDGEITGGPAELAGTVADILTPRTPHS
jgi:hypothetical protein